MGATDWQALQDKYRKAKLPTPESVAAESEKWKGAIVHTGSAEVHDLREAFALIYKAMAPENPNSPYAGVDGVVYAWHEIQRLAVLGAKLEKHHQSRSILIAEDDWDDGCPLCGDKR